MKRKLLLSILAAVPAVFLPITANCQIAPDRPAHAVSTVPTTKWEAMVGYGYTSLNQIPQSRHGLQGVNAAVTRDLSAHFGITADGAYYAYDMVGNAPSNPGNFTVDSVLLGPVLRAKLFERIDGFVRVLLGAEHTSVSNPLAVGYTVTPSLSLAGGVGVGLDYNLKSRLSLRFSADSIESSFGYGPKAGTGTGFSPHERRNARVGLGVVYHF